MASARVFFSKRRQQRNGFINEEVPVVENGYEPQDSDEDEVFVQDPNLEISASKPLMHPRSKGGRSKVKTRTINCGICSLCKPIFYFAALVTVLCSVMATIVYIANRHRGQANKTLLNGGITSDSQGVKEKVTFLGCDNVFVEDVWTVGFPKLLTESAFRLVDVNGDGTQDVIFGFATGADGFGAMDIVCDLYFGGQRPCLGGVMALDGKTGSELWRHYTSHEVYALNCQYDVDKDGTLDCLAGGRAGVLVCVSGKDGALIWTMDNDKSDARISVMNFYTPQYVGDLDRDEVADIVVMHGGDPLQELDSKSRLAGRILLISGRTGSVLRWLKVPDGRESYYSPQVVSRLEGVRLVLFGTGGESHNGSMWRLELNSLVKGMADRAVKISSDTHKGFMTPPALVDLTGDGVEDILVPSFNSTLLAVDGNTFNPLWRVRFESSESYSTPAIGYYNDDDTPDALVKFAHGPGYPVYFYSQTTVIDGKTGARLIDPPLRDTIGSQSSGLTVAMEGRGNDVFLMWMADCKGHEGASDQFAFTKETSVKEKTHSDLCGLRFKSKPVSRFIAISQHLPADGATVYNSETRKELEHSMWVNTSQEAYDYVIQHPDILDKYRGPSWEKPDEETRRPLAEEEYGNQAGYPGLHRATSKKGPSLPPTRPRPRPNTSSSGSSSSSSSSSSRRPNGLPRGNSPTRGGNRGRQPDSPISSHYVNTHGSSGNPYQSEALSQNSRSRLYPPNNQDDEYEFPYKDEDASSFYGGPFGQYSSNGRGRDRDDGDVYQERYPYGYRYYPQRRRTIGRRKRRKRSGGDDVLYSRTKRKEETLSEWLSRTSRHVGPHDNDGIQRLISTGTLAPTLLSVDHDDHNRTIDVIFATYWTYPSHTTAILEEDQKCISEKLGNEMIARFDEDSPFYQMTHEEYEKAATQSCLESSDHQLPPDGIYKAADENYNPFKLNMGQMTVYRLRLKFTCSQDSNSTATDSNSRCATVLPFSNQKWAAYMGTSGDSHWATPRP